MAWTPTVRALLAGVGIVGLSLCWVILPVSPWMTAILVVGVLCNVFALGTAIMGIDQED